MSRLVLFFRRQWFLTTLTALIVTGMLLGLGGHGPQVKPWLAFVHPRITTAFVLFLMAFSLDSHLLGAAFRAPGPVIVGFGMNYLFVPLFAWLLSPWQEHVDFRSGLMIAATVPCTVAAASVMTRKARGNDAVSLLITVATNSICFVLTPLWLSITIAKRVELDTGRMIVQLLEAVLVPTLLGQLLRQPPRLMELAKRYKTPIGVMAQVLIEALVLTAALDAGAKLREMHSQNAATMTRPAGESTAAEAMRPLPVPAAGESPVVTAGGAIKVWLSCVVVHVTALFCGLFLARRLGFRPADCSAVAFAGSQKTLPVGLYIATDPGMFGVAHPFAVFPMLLYHTSQLFFDTATAGWLARRSEEPAAAAPSAPTTGDAR